MGEATEGSGNLVVSYVIEVGKHIFDGSFYISRTKADDTIYQLERRYDDLVRALGCESALKVLFLGFRMGELVPERHTLIDGLFVDELELREVLDKLQEMKEFKEIEEEMERITKKLATSRIVKRIEESVSKSIREVARKGRVSLRKILIRLRSRLQDIRNELERYEEKLGDIVALMFLDYMPRLGAIKLGEKIKRTILEHLDVIRRMGLSLDDLQNTIRIFQEHRVGRPLYLFSFCPFCLASESGVGSHIFAWGEYKVVRQVTCCPSCKKNMVVYYMMPMPYLLAFTLSRERILVELAMAYYIAKRFRGEGLLKIYVHKKVGKRKINGLTKGREIDILVKRNDGMYAIEISTSKNLDKVTKRVKEKLRGFREVELDLRRVLFIAPVKSDIEVHKFQEEETYGYDALLLTASAIKNLEKQLRRYLFESY